MGYSGCFPLGKPAATQPTVHAACFRVSLIQQTTANSDTDCRIFNVHTDVTACDCTQGCTDTVRESALKVGSGRKIPSRTGESNLPQRRAGPELYPLSYIPTLGALRLNSPSKTIQERRKTFDLDIHLDPDSNHSSKRSPLHINTGNLPQQHVVNSHDH